MNQYSNTVVNFAFCVDCSNTDELKEFIRSNYTEENRLALIEDAQRRKVLPVVGKKMVELNIDVDFWSGQYQYYLERNQKVTALLADIFCAFSEEGIRKICAYENYGALLSSGVDIALYSSGDVDLFADISERERISQTLEKFEYYPTDDWNNKQGICTEYLKENGIIRINVAWKPLIRYSLPIKSGFEKYFVWDEMRYYKETAIRLPSTETLLYLCFLRIAVHGYSRSPDIRLYIDTYTSSRHNPDWKTVMRWAKEDGVLTKFCAVAAIANNLIKLEVPDYVLRTAENDKYVRKILKLTYDSNESSLLYYPSGWTLLKIEAASDSRNILQEMFTMVCPPVSWLREYFGNCDENLLRVLIRYYKHFL